MERRLGNIFGFTGGNYAGNVYDKNYMCPTLNTMQGGCKQPMIIENITCKLDKMPEGTLTSINEAKICDVGTETASTITARYHKGIGAHKDNMCIVAMRDTQPMIIDDTYANREPRVYEDFAPSLRSEREGFKTLEMKRLGNVYNEKFNGCDFGGNVWDKEGIAPTMKTTAAASQQCVIVAMRGRNPENPSDRTVGAPTEQRLEPNSQGICNTLTSVTKDNLVMEVKQVGFMDNGTGKHQSNTVYDENGVCPNITTIDGGTQQIKVATETVKIKQATSQGYIECELGGVADLSFPDSKTRRGRVQENGQVSPALMAGDQDICRIEKNPILVGGIGEKWGEKQYRQGN